MWPWGHLAFGYLLYSPGLRATAGRTPEGPAVLALALGTQLPDIVDKPLAWYLGVLPHGRSLMHSVFALIVVAAVAVRLGRRYQTPAGVALAVGQASHLVGDGYQSLLAGDWANLTYLFWPLLPVPVDTIHDVSLLGLLSRLSLSPEMWVELLVGLVVVALWVRDGTPGLGTTRRLVRRAFGDGREETPVGDRR